MEDKVFTTKLTGDKLRQKIELLHDHENDFNKEIGDIDKKIRQLNVRKNKLSKSISKNVLYRNNLIKFIERD